MNNNRKRIDTICFGGQDWWYHNRGHIDMQLMRRFARLGTTLYVNSIVMQKPNIGEGKMFVKRVVRKTKSIFTGLKKSDAGFWVYSPFTLPVHHIFWARPLNELLLRRQMENIIRKLEIHDPIIWVACPGICNVAIKMKKAKLVYQRTDRMEEYPNADVETVKYYDQKLKSAADITIFVNKMLFDEESGQCKEAIYLDHGVDFSMFAFAEDSEDTPSEMQNIKGPIVGFFGDIEDHLLDIEFTTKVIDMLPEMSFVFVGKALVDCSELRSRSNVWMLGQKPYEQIPHYGKYFDVAIMPWNQNRWIEACNPVKLKEYLALGKPVVSTSFPELQNYLDVTYTAKTPEEFVSCIKKALAEDGLEKIAARRNKVQAFTWDSKAQMVLNQLYKKDTAG